MNSKSVFKLALLHLIYLLMKVDNEIDFREVKYLERILQEEDISDELLTDFKVQLSKLNDQEIFNRGVKLVGLCTEGERIRVFSILHTMAAADGKFHESELRFLTQIGMFSSNEICIV